MRIWIQVKLSKLEHLMTIMNLAMQIIQRA